MKSQLPKHILLIESKIPPYVIVEAVYDGNMGFEEMMRFYDEATPQQINKLERFISQGKEKEAWELLQDVLNVDLKGK